MKWHRATSDMQGKFYKSIDELPLDNWIKCTGGDIRYVRKKVDEKEEISEQDMQIWQTFYDEYINKFGLSDLYKRLLEVQKKKALLECEYTIKRKKFKITLINLEEARLNEMMNNAGEGMDIPTTLIYLSKWLGYHLDEKKITTLYYFNTLKQYGKENKQSRHK
tara:strand:- start:2330 stop:2821 length:492 start_codon:yes stop_codon:yes gene_type:complete